MFVMGWQTKWTFQTSGQTLSLRRRYVIPAAIKTQTNKAVFSLVGAPNETTKGFSSHFRFANEDALQEIRRVLKPGGKLGIVWNIEDCALP